MNTTKFTASVCMIAILFIGCKAQTPKVALQKQNDNNTLLWQISGKGLQKPSYLFGTFHLLCKEDIKISEALKIALIASDKIFMELDMDDPSTMLSGLLYMNMKDGKTIKELYTPQEYDKVTSYFDDSLSMPIMMFQKMKPYFLVALLYPKMMNCKTSSGMEEALVVIAKENKKEITGLETMQFQASVFDSIPYEWQAKELLKNIDSFAKYKTEFDVLVKDYKEQQLSNMEKLIAKSEFGSEKFQDILLTRRNENWVKQLKAIMPKQNLFVAVGAGHLTGDKGLLNLLKKEGYKVEPLVNK